MAEIIESEYQLALEGEPGVIEGTLALPRRARGIVLFAHGTGSSRYSPRNRFVAGVLQRAGFATLLLDLLTEAEAREDELTAELRFDVAMLARRVALATDWLRRSAQTADLPMGYFGASTGAAAALIAASTRSSVVRAVVSRGGRPDLAGAALPHVLAPTLLIVGQRDTTVLALNRDALKLLVRAPSKRLAIVPRASHLFEEPGTLDEVARLASGWLFEHVPIRHERPGAHV